MSCFSPKLPAPSSAPGERAEGSVRARQTEASTASRGPRGRRGRAGWALAPSSPGSGCEEVKPAATESGTSVSKSPRHTKRREHLGRTGRGLPSPGPAPGGLGAAIPSRGCPPVSRTLGGRWSLELFGKSARGCACPALCPARPCVRSHGPGVTARPCSGLYTVEDVQKAGGCRLPHRSGQLPQEAAPARHAPVRPSVRPCGPGTGLPFPDTEASVRLLGGGGCRSNSVHTGVHADRL